MYKVVEIFDSIEGEGKRVGRPATFIRLAGCNLRCTYCDTAYALFGEAEECKFTEMSLDDILNRKLKRCVTITGGEPLIQDGIRDLTNELLMAGHEVNIETNGAADILSFIEALQIHDEDELFFTIDYKLPSSGECDKMLWQNFESLMPQDVVKFVVGSDEDFDKMMEVVARLNGLYAQMPNVYIGAVYGSYDVKKLTEKVVAEPLLENANIQLQIHKIIWNPEERGV